MNDLWQLASVPSFYAIRNGKWIALSITDKKREREREGRREGRREREREREGKKGKKEKL